MSRNSSLTLHAAVVLASVLGACVNNANTRGDLSATVAISPTRKLYIECRGNGSPTVVLVAGQRGSAAEWSITESTTSAADQGQFRGDSDAGKCVQLTNAIAIARNGVTTTGIGVIELDFLGKIG